MKANNNHCASQRNIVEEDYYKHPKEAAYRNDRTADYTCFAFHN